MKKNSIIIASATLALSLFFFTACTSSKTSQTSETTTKESSSTTQTTEEKVDLNSLDLPQLDSNVTEDEDLVEFVTTEGNIKVKLFPKLAPKAVENFMTHAKDGYYDGVKFHRVISDFMIQSGDPKGDGTGGDSIWGEEFAPEISNQLYHIDGALAMARTGKFEDTKGKTQGSQFYIVHNTEDVSDGLLAEDYPQKIIEAYKKGGTPKLDKHYSVFGQVVEGMDVVDKISKAEVKAGSSGETSTPVNDIKIEKINILQEAK